MGVAYPRHRGRLRPMLAAVCLGALLLLLSFALAPSQAQAQGTGFTGDYWWCDCVVGPDGDRWSPERHSYGFSSTTNISLSAQGYVAARIWNGVTERDAAITYGYNLARACVHGTYPNCTDTDGWYGEGIVWNRSSVNLRLRGHGVF